MQQSVSISMRTNCALLFADLVLSWYESLFLLGLVILHHSSNKTTSAAYGINISKLIRYFGTRSCYADFIKRHQYLSKKLMKQSYIVCQRTSRLMSKKSKTEDTKVFVDKYSLTQIIHDGFKVYILSTEVVYPLNYVLQCFVFVFVYF